MVLSTEQLLRLRNGYRTQCRETITNANGALDDQAQHSVAVLTSHINILNGIQRSLEDIGVQIMDDLEDKDQIEEEILESGQVSDSLVLTLTKLQTLVDVLERREQQQEDDRRSVVLNPVTVIQRGGGFHAKLPKLTLPNFSGDPLQWATFWDAYESSVHNQPMLPPVDKFNYLRSLLRGVALDSISGVAVTNANYDTAVNLIQQRFGQKQAIINGHVEALVNLSKVTSDDTTKLRAIYDAAEIHIRGLETQEVTSTNNGAVLTPILLTKLPEDIRLIITRKNDGPIGNLDQLRELLRNEIQVRELSSLTIKKSPSGKPEKDYIRFSMSTASALVHTSHSQSTYCPFCKTQGHTVFNCTKYTTPDDRRKQTIANKLCHNCLRAGHLASKCESKWRCKRCHRRHHTLMCTELEGTQPHTFRNQTSVNMIIDQPSDITGDQHNSTSQVLLSSSDTIWMQTARVAVHDSAGKQHVVRILFDTGSHQSYITQKLAQKLSLSTVKTEVIKVGTFGGHHARPHSYNVVQFQCSNLVNNASHSFSTIVVPEITSPVFRAPLSGGISTFQQLVLADPPSDRGQWMDIDVLVGLDHYWQLVEDQVLRLPEHGLTAMSSVFGWLVSGSSNTTKEFHCGNSPTLFTVTSPTSQDGLLTQFWASETFDSPSPLNEESSLEDVILKRFEQTVQFTDGRYQVGLPWKIQACKLPTNEQLCRNRFNSLIRRLKRENVMSQYADVIEQQAKLQFIEKVTDFALSSGPVHYIPHHPVIKKDHATTKLRIVYDASAQQTPEDPSLNDTLYSGPNLVCNLIKLLLLFRSYPIVLLADIEKAFLQVGLLAEDRDATRFLWLKDVNKPATDDNVEVWRFRRVPFGATLSPFLLAATLHHHLKSSDTQVAAKMLDNFYVDNLIVGVQTISEAAQFYCDAKQLMSNAGMNLREWMSNDHEVMKQIPIFDQAKGGDIKVLGLPWSINDDVIHTKGVANMSDAVKPTKKQILQAIAKVFDPMGLVSPVVIAAKIFI